MKLRKKKLPINIDTTLAVGLIPAAFCMFEMFIFVHKKTPIPPERMRENSNGMSIFMWQVLTLIPVNH